MGWQDVLEFLNEDAHLLRNEYAHLFLSYFTCSTGILAEIFGQPPTNCNKSKLNRFWFLNMSSVTEKSPKGSSGGEVLKSWKSNMAATGFGENVKIVKIDILTCKYMFFCILIVSSYGQYIDIQE